MARPPVAERKDQIITAALELFLRNGLASVSTRDLAEHTGLSRSHLYHYFSDWKTLRRAAFERFSEEQLAGTQALLQGLDPEPALIALMRDCLPARKDDAAWTLWLDAWDESLHDPELAEAYRLALGQWQGLLQGLIAEGCASGVFSCDDLPRATRQITALANSYAADLLLEPSPITLEAALEEIIEVAGLLLGTPRLGARLKPA
ncbi:TetR/AcrR family transcriptional regulator [Pseudomonas sp. zfem003]|uniref:TetR/AcrR family transcriptional regulator n=1 Tax=Pseudomonas sp. zfem003 TaxID=3078198 RepID=UPI00292845E7|nr:TetR/AcrR family transcriptional regulator [Pseudomonas sp. zfem003]MDU9397538.1 TetR/AcrR family transcriptional regulator [Pseudomonas sp. zfem003]